MAEKTLGFGGDTLPAVVVSDLESARTVAASGEDVDSVGSAPRTPATDPRGQDGASPTLPARYERRALLGEGGMGTVDLCRDLTIGREVAIKRIRPAALGSAGALERFVREARVQGQLEHPAIVPVHDLATAPDGTTYFTMKRVRGESLDDVLRGLAAGVPEVSARHGRRRLLGAFATVCLAVDFAHSRGVLHRDLKPANVMLGDYGEVYVLDWGLAKVRREHVEPAPPATDGSVPPRVALESSSEGATLHGALLGTPGYMSPEQARGEVDTLDERSDVYALGAILFEILHLEPLHPGKTMAERLAATLTGITYDMPRKRAADVPPELDAVWRDAAAIEPNARIGSARELAERVERYLDGERDEARRRELADGHVARARELDARTPEGRAAAMRELGRALALEPTHDEALRALSRTLTDLPAEVPEDARRAIQEAHTEGRVQMARTSAVRLATWILVVPMVIAFGVLDWARGAALIASLVLSAATALFTWRARAVSDGWTLGLLGVSSVAIALVSFVFGPFVVVPSLAATNAMFFAMNAERPLRRAVVAASVSAIALPFLASMAGLEAGYYSFAGGAMTITSPMVTFPPGLALAFLLAVSVALVVTPTLLAGRMRDALAKAEERVILQAHYLAQLVPDLRAPEDRRSP